MISSLGTSQREARITDQSEPNTADKVALQAKFQLNQAKVSQAKERGQRKLAPFNIQRVWTT
jgi:hypothetical protein